MMNENIIYDEWYSIYEILSDGSERLVCGAVTEDDALDLLPEKYAGWVSVIWEKIIPSPDLSILTFWKGIIM